MAAPTPVTAPARSSRRGHCLPVKGSAGFDVVINGGHRERNGVTMTPGQWICPEQVPVTMNRGGASHVVGSGRVFIDRKGNPRVRGLWAATPMGEYMKTLVNQRIMCFANVELEASIDDDGARVYGVVGASFTLPAAMPSAGEAAEPAAELLGLAARIYAARPDQRAALADLVIGCAVELGGTVPG